MHPYPGQGHLRGHQPSGRLAKNGNVGEKNPSARQQDFLGVPWLGAAEPVIDISKSQNVGWEPLSLERREIGTWSWSMAGILKGFLFNALFAFKKENRPHLGTGEGPACGAPGAGASTPHQTRASTAAIFNTVLVFAWQNLGLEKQKVFLPDSINFSSSSSGSNLVLSDACLTRVASSGVWGSCGVSFSESVGSPCPYFLFHQHMWPDRMMGK